jgi:hypothetical protein
MKKYAKNKRKFQEKSRRQESPTGGIVLFLTD